MPSGYFPRSFTPGILVLVLTAGVCGSAVLYSTGIVGVTKKPNHVFLEPGCFCHGELPSAAVRAWIEGPESLQAGAAAIYVMHVAKDSSVAAGFNVAAFFGSLGVVESTATQLAEPAPGEQAEITHLMPRPADGRDTISWSFLYRAPFTAGVVETLYSNGNSVNLSGDPDGDQWAFSPSLLVHVVPATGVGESPAVIAYRLHQNYPNPFNPSTTIAFELSSAGMVHLTVFDLAGREVAVLVNGQREAGVHTVTFNPTTTSPHGPLASGVYLYRLRISMEQVSGGGQIIMARKMVLLR